ncbi:MAG: AcrR family transcriptional regulator [Verrucomicrobiales bacterium]|jgi:AcrR family transcriptional regulator
MARPRSIPEEESLERALKLFWDKGFDRTSIADLGKVLGVGPSSIYNAFGSKEALYQRALGHYMQTHTGFVTAIFAEAKDSSIEVCVRKLLRTLAEFYSSKETPLGCALLQSGGAGRPENSEACEFTCGVKADVEDAIRELFETRLKAGDELAASPHILAKFIAATMRGLSQLACDGTSQSDLLQVADHAARSCLKR